MTTCPHCHKEINPAALLRSIKSEERAKASRLNGKKGGRPRKVLCRKCGSDLVEVDTSFGVSTDKLGRTYTTEWRHHLCLECGFDHMFNPEKKGTK